MRMLSCLTVEQLEDVARDKAAPAIKRAVAKQMLRAVSGELKDLADIGDRLEVRPTIHTSNETQTTIKRVLIDHGSNSPTGEPAPESR